MAALPYNYLTQQSFDLFSGYWKVVVNSSSTNYSLSSCFLSGKASYVGFTSDQIGALISTVGAVSIEARFICVPDAKVDNTSPVPSPNPSLTGFGVVLYAADRCGNALSAYYLGNPNSQPPQAQNTNMTLPTSAGDSQNAVQIPHYLAALWMDNWSKACSNGGSGINPSMFITASGTLEGYSFSLGDLSQSLFNAQPVPNVDFYTLLHFGLHQTYTQANPGTLTYTFGLIMRLYSTNANAKGLIISSEPFYDMSAPRPPH